MDKELLNWLQAALKRNRPLIENSAVFLQLWSQKISDDPRAMLQLGLAVALDKPIYIVVPPGTRSQLSQSLQRLAAGILEADFHTEEGRLKAGAWLNELQKLRGDTN